MPMDLDTHARLGLHAPPPQEVNGRSNADILVSLNHAGDAPYHPCAEAYPEDNVPQGTVTKYSDWDQSDVYPDTVRDLQVYVPPGYDPASPAPLLVCNDGFGYLARRGPVRATQVLATLQAREEIEPTIAIFINPGRPPGSDPMGGVDDESARLQRRHEYDSLTPDYGNMLIEDVLPFVIREQGLNISTRPEQRTVCGISSGGICAFTVAWLHPEQFRRVISHCGSFTNILGGHNYPYLIRTTPRKPLRVFLQSGANDAETLAGDWPLANKTLANACAYAGYDYRFEFGTGGHSLRHAGALFADTLRWLWRSDAS